MKQSDLFTTLHIRLHRVQPGRLPGTSKSQPLCASSSGVTTLCTTTETLGHLPLPIHVTPPSRRETFPASSSGQCRKSRAGGDGSGGLSPGCRVAGGVAGSGCRVAGALPGQCRVAGCCRVPGCCRGAAGVLPGCCRVLPGCEDVRALPGAAGCCRVLPGCSRVAGLPGCRVAGLPGRAVRLLPGLCSSCRVAHH